MSFMRSIVFSLFSVAVLFIQAASSASAATLNVSGGQLLGAFGVDVGGNLYNVDFLNGTCIALYDGCDDVSDFTFQTFADADLASQALLDQVFLNGADLFDTAPELTNGCNPPQGEVACLVVTPFDVSDVVINAVAWNHAIEADDITASAGPITPDQISRIASGRTWAVWTPVPEPGTAVLMGLGLLGLSVRNRREG
jgi:hypothetical protein